MPCTKKSLILQTFAVLIMALVALRTASAAPIRESEEIDWKKEREFWAFRAPLPQAIPKVHHKRWPRQDLDYFVLAQLERKGLVPSHEPGKRTLIRRLSFDLTGLPPTPGEIASFVSDKRPDAYTHLVDRLLGSKSFGERMASLWLPLARYAEDQAHQVGDDTKYFYPNAFKYREWVINAFNRDLPYNQFVEMQLAADSLGQTNDLAALGFLGLGPKYYDRGQLSVMADEWEDRVDTVSRTFLGLTVACARCHDHKFDPITRADYYGLAGIFASTKMVTKTPGGETDKAEKAEKVSLTALHIVEDDKPQDLHVFIRGNVDRKGPLAPREFIQILAGDHPKPFDLGSGRQQLALAIADTKNPLTARVMVNRLWGALLGQPIVSTPSNFGHSGSLPNNPELLDALATQFMHQGWSTKSLVRQIVLSATYRQASLSNPKSAAMDSDNQNLWRMNRRRLSIEQWRDSILMLAGKLESGGGKSLELEDPTNYRRTVYARISRLQLNNVLMQFDYPDANVHAEKRSTTTTPIQKLYEMNSGFILDSAKTIANRITAQKPGVKSDASRQVDAAYQLILDRPPDRSEKRLGLDFLKKTPAPNLSRWDEYIQALLISNEMFYVD
jgi:hypothetical protein